jgi:RNAse (barnase) inhibitor barstar
MATIKNIEDLKRFLTEDFMRAVEYQTRVDKLIDILMGNIYGENPVAIEEFLEKNGYSREQVKQMTTNETHEAWRKVWDKNPPGTDTLVAALDLLFNARYGWPEGSALKLTPAQAYLALEHAVEYDALGKPSIWNITK